MVPVAGISITNKLFAAFIELCFGKSFHQEVMDYFVFVDNVNIGNGRAAMPEFIRGVAPHSFD
ncbi:hypothetical protein [Endozoicomonas sp. SESOKO1]|uniref:hypothetical protein n=1 Tax=Endozoicomonas sp. SESOKO1 TaxID=2828742 RepID=UPI00214948C3|nr:hypothetical protein [Endozoicomonas sp. SESOKO1]